MDEKQKTGFGRKFGKVLLALLIPLLFLLLLTGLFLKLAGIDPINEAKSMLFGSGRNPSVQSIHSPAATTSGLKQQIAGQNRTIKQLQNDNKNKADQIAQLQNQLKQAQNQSAQQNQVQKSRNQAALQSVYAQTYRNMDPVKAAAIFEKLSIKQAAKYMNMLDDKTKASIMQNMTPAKAAAVTQLLKAPAGSGSSTSSALSGSADSTTTTTSSVTSLP
jgi:flagellar motility protein MotE (MotC chaperone)